MSDETSHPSERHDNPPYQAPRALRLGDAGQAHGGFVDCKVPGSSASDCLTGATAVGCLAAGSGAQKCGGPGSSAVPEKE